MSEFIVKNCHHCPFVNQDNEYGYDGCNHPFNFGKAETDKYDWYSQLPFDKIHDNCPLKKEPITVKIDLNE